MTRLSIKVIRENAMKKTKMREALKTKTNIIESLFINYAEIFYILENGIMYRDSNDIGKESFYEFLHRKWNHIQTLYDIEEDAKRECILFLSEVRQNECKKLSAKSRCFVNILMDSFAIENDICFQPFKISFHPQPQPQPQTSPKSRIRDKILYYICPIKLSSTDVQTQTYKNVYPSSLEIPIN